MSSPRAPQGLGRGGKAFWRRVMAIYELSPPEELMLARACRVVDVLDRLDSELTGADLMVEGSMGQMRPHPGLAAAADQQRLLDQLVRALNLPLPGEDVGRRRSPSARQAAWSGGGGPGDGALAGT